MYYCCCKNTTITAVAYEGFINGRRGLKINNYSVVRRLGLKIKAGELVFVRQVYSDITVL